MSQSFDEWCNTYEGTLTGEWSETDMQAAWNASREAALREAADAVDSALDGTELKDYFMQEILALIKEQ